MNSTLEKVAVTHNDAMSRSEQDWREYLGITPDQLQVSRDHRYRLALARLFQQYEHENRKIFHLTVTYKPYPLEDFTPDKTNRYFINFYLKSFLPLLMRSKNYHIPSKRPYQPICYAFLDEHDQKVSSSGVMFPDRLHHHAMLAVHQNTYSSAKSLESVSKISLKTRFSNKVMTTHLRECEPMTMLYATKNLRKFPEFLSFPDRFI